MSMHYKYESVTVKCLLILAHFFLLAEQIFKHTLPPFIPLGSLKPLLVTAMGEFCLTVSELLNAYVDRREQVSKN